MEKVFVAQRVANKLHATEAAIDAAIIEAAELVSEMISARKDLKVSAIFADEAQAKLMEAMKTLSDARSEMVDVHNKLNEAQLRLGVRTRMDLAKPPGWVSPEDQQRAPLREVV